MPTYASLLKLYVAHASAAASGALERERDQVAAPALDAAARGFLSATEQADWTDLSVEAQAARLRLGRQRLRRWEISNPDIVSLLRRKARSVALS